MRLVLEFLGTFALVDSIGGPSRFLATGIKPGLLSVVYESSVGVETGLLIVEHSVRGGNVQVCAISGICVWICCAWTAAMT